MSVPIIEIIGRATQGVTRPFICRSADQALWFVKGKGAGKRSLVCEWVAGMLALKMNLPVAPFAIVDIPSDLIALGTRNDLGELGAGLAFGSRKLEAVELTRAHLPQIPEATQRDVLVFDWWVNNADRSLRNSGGNPNLFWHNGTKQLVVLDHNLAFDPDFSPVDFARTHAFHRQIKSIQCETVLQQYYANTFASILPDWDEICDAVPEQWWFIDAEQTLPVDFERNVMRQWLARYQETTFWKMT